jgi:predicted transcriptional regulator
MFADDEADSARIHPRKQRKARVSVAMRKSRRWPWASVGTPRGRAELRGRRAHVFIMLQTSETAAEREDRARADVRADMTRKRMLRRWLLP